MYLNLFILCNKPQEPCYPWQFKGNQFQATLKKEIPMKRIHSHFNVHLLFLGMIRHCLKNYSSATELVLQRALQLVASKQQGLFVFDDGWFCDGCSAKRCRFQHNEDSSQVLSQKLYICTFCESIFSISICKHSFLYVVD